MPSPETASVAPATVAWMAFAVALARSRREPFWSEMEPAPNRTARTGAPEESRPAIPAKAPDRTRSPAAFLLPDLVKIQRSSRIDPGATTAPAPVSDASRASTRVRDAQEEVATGISAIMNCVDATLLAGRTRTQEVCASGSKFSIRLAVWEPVVAVHCPGATTRTPSDMPFLPIPCTQPEAVSTDTPSWKWQIQSYACGDEASRSSWIRAYRLRASTATRSQRETPSVVAKRPAPWAAAMA